MFFPELLAPHNLMKLQAFSDNPLCAVVSILGLLKYVLALCW